jgi:hypothetical protein
MLFQSKFFKKKIPKNTSYCIPNSQSILNLTVSARLGWVSFY